MPRPKNSQIGRALASYYTRCCQLRKQGLPPPDKIEYLKLHKHRLHRRRDPNAPAREARKQARALARLQAQEAQEAATATTATPQPASAPRARVQHTSIPATQQTPAPATQPATTPAKCGAGNSLYSPGELSRLIDGYFRSLEPKPYTTKDGSTAYTPPKPPTLTHLAVYCGISHQRLSTYSQMPQYKAIMQAAKKRIEAAWEARLWDSSSAGATFWLKNRAKHEWKDRQSVEHTGNLSISALLARLDGDARITSKTLENDDDVEILEGETVGEAVELGAGDQAQLGAGDASGGPDSDACI